MLFFAILQNYILGPEWESSDEEEEPEQLKVYAKVENTKKGKATTSSNKKKSTTLQERSNVIYIGHLPKHCEERELIGFLKQFGNLLQLRVCRSQKTGGVKGYAFARFQDSEVAAIVADTLNGHLLFQKRLVCHVVPPEQVHNKLFSSKTRTIFQRRSKLLDKGPKSLEKVKEVTERLRNNEKKKRETLKALGIDYDFPGYEASLTGGGTKKKENKKAVEEEDDEKMEVVQETPTNSSSKAKKKKRKSSEGAAEKPSGDLMKKDLEKESEKTNDRPQSEKKRKKDKKKRRKTN